MEADPRDKLIAELREENAQLTARVTELEKQVESLLKQVQELRLQAHRQAAPFRRPEKKRKPKGKGRPPGRPPGHQAFYRVQAPQIDEEVVVVPLEACPICGGQVEPRSVKPCVQYVEDLP